MSVLRAVGEREKVAGTRKSAARAREEGRTRRQRASTGVTARARARTTTTPTDVVGVRASVYERTSEAVVDIDGCGTSA